MRWSIHKKMMIGYVVIISIMIATNAFLLVEFHGLSLAARTTLTTEVESINILRSIRTILADEGGYAEKFLVSRHALYDTLFTEARRSIDLHIDSLMTLHPSPAEIDLIHTIRQSHATLVAIHDVERRAVRRARQSDADGQRKAVTERVAETDALCQQLIRLNQAAIGTSMASLETTTNRSFTFALLLTVVTFLLAVGLAFVIARTITRPIGILIRGTRQIAEGSFEPIRVTARDEVALLTDAVNTMSERLKTIEEFKANLMQQIAHELGTPLSTILGAHYMLTTKLPGPLTSEQKKMLDTIRENVDRLSQFSHQFLDLAKIRSGMMEYSFVPTDVSALLTPLVENARIGATRKDIRIDLRIDPLPLINADPEKFSMTISNLISNAVKYTGTGGAVSVQVGPFTGGVRITVSDTGSGIPADELPFIFTKFYRVKKNGKSSGKGTGIGLALVRAFTEGHGGSVSVRSEVGKGSTFTLEFPITPPGAGRPNSSQQGT